jgi:RNA polymerase sigma-70 factor, ECF subfamily
MLLARPASRKRNDKDEVKDLTPTDDAELLRRAQSGDRDAFATIVVAHQAAALRLATIITGDSTEAYDIVQDSFVRAYRALPSLRDSTSLRSWVLRIVANQAKNSRRSQWRRDARHSRQAALSPVVSAGADDAVLSMERAEQLLAALGRLPERDRSIVACRYFAGMNEAEAADVLGIARGTVKSRTARALARLREELGDEMEGSS